MTNKSFKNRYGLSRPIPLAVAQAVRQRDGFGCVVCGCAIYEYEHFDPEFKDAKFHDQNGIILLCDSCHRKKGRFLSRQTIKKSAQNPRAKQVGFSHEAFDFDGNHPTIVIGELTAKNVGSVLEIDGISLFSVSPPEIAGGPIRLNASFYNHHKKLVMEVIDNEWRPCSDNWDVEVVGPRIKIRNAKRDYCLILRSDPPERIIVERLHMTYGHTTIATQEGKQITISSTRGQEIVGQRLSIEGSQVAVKIDDSGFKLGVGGGRVAIGSLTMSSRGSSQPTMLIDVMPVVFNWRQMLLATTAIRSPRSPYKMLRR